MVFGDTVAIALMGARNLSKEEYAANHPAGRIGKSLILKVKDLMKKKQELPLCREEDQIMDQLLELTSKGCGCLLVIDDDYHLLGTFTDGDLRRTLMVKASGEGIFELTVGEMCNSDETEDNKTRRNGSRSNAKDGISTIARSVLARH
ncbi:putative arabinose 5-phosphate isomerase [Orobanche minor]